MRHRVRRASHRQNPGTVWFRRRGYCRDFGEEALAGKIVLDALEEFLDDHNLVAELAKGDLGARHHRQLSTETVFAYDAPMMRQ